MTIDLTKEKTEILNYRIKVNEEYISQCEASKAYYESKIAEAKAERTFNFDWTFLGVAVGLLAGIGAAFLAAKTTESIIHDPYDF